MAKALLLEHPNELEVEWSVMLKLEKVNKS